MKAMSDIDSDLQAFITEVFQLVRGKTPEGAEYSAAQRLQALLDAGLDANLSNEEGNSLLMLAAYNGQTDLVEILLGHGAAVDQMNDRGQTPLAGAVFKKDIATVQVLVSAGADPQAGGPSALATAQMFQLDDILSILGADN